MEIIDLKENEYFLRDYSKLCLEELGQIKDESQLKNKIEDKTEKILLGLDTKLIVALGLIDNKKLLGFISLFKTDGVERNDLSPWYATMYVKKEYRGKGYSILLNNAILEKAKELGYDRVYLKTNLLNYYEKFGAKYIEKLNSGENLYYISLI